MGSGAWVIRACWLDVFLNWEHRHANAVAASALRDIDREYKNCLKPYQTAECKRYPVACEIPLAGCRERKTAAEESWAERYPRQAARRRAEWLEAGRKRDEENFRNSQP